jgi:RNA polymerase sigma-70 factor (ECF subfamily)
MTDEQSFTPPAADFIANITRAQRTLHAFILSMVRKPADAEDVLQETNLVLWKKAAEFDPTRDFMPWAMRIAQLQSLAFLKKKPLAWQAFDEELLSVLASEAIDDWTETEKRRTALNGCLAKLPEQQRALIVKRYEPGGSVNAMSQERARRRKPCPRCCGASDTICCSASKARSSGSLTDE